MRAGKIWCRKSTRIRKMTDPFLSQSLAFVGEGELRVNKSGDDEKIALPQKAPKHE